MCLWFQLIFLCCFSLLCLLEFVAHCFFLGGGVLCVSPKFGSWFFEGVLPKDAGTERVEGRWSLQFALNQDSRSLDNLDLPCGPIPFVVPYNLFTGQRQKKEIHEVSRKPVDGHWGFGLRVLIVT